ncbi:hypothetical protein [Aquibacillus salsiterrae]|uniref:Flagellar hook-length control protein FliK n=1 Tax=Aquibacillus salsiterrae TaxID=2950439 RepID=A0A9X4AE78_9BACI|nr:hypothetical protein [Aquibacillus salsiterrae]MDC3416411.1 hypothetical protein [Aquibacillus salsiterrae]
MAGLYVNGTSGLPGKAVQGTHAKTKEVQLKEGQVLIGKVLKLFPNNQAEIILAGKPMVAKLFASLSSNKHYWFQVESTGNAPHLRVISNQPITSSNQVEQLLLEFGLTNAEENRRLVRGLIDRKIPIDKATLIKLVGILSRQAAKEISFQALETMLKHELPITNSVYQAIHHRSSSSLTDQLVQLYNQVNDTEGSLRQLLELFVLDPSYETEPLVSTLVHSKEQGLFDDLLTKAKLFSSRTISSGQLLLGEETVQNITNQSMEGNQKRDTQPVVREADSNNLMKYLRPLLREKLPESLERELVRLLTVYDRIPTDSWDDMKYKFLLHLKQFRFFSGIDHEGNMLKNEGKAYEQTLKSLVIQAMKSTGENSLLERLLHTINGMQLTGVEEGNFLSSLSLQLPGNRLGLLNDVYLNMKGKKNSSNKIDTDFCHIYFYLHLKNIGETIIDMKIQKRSVNMTVKNKNSKVKPILATYRPILKASLAKLDYHLSSVKFEKIEEIPSNRTNSSLVSSPHQQGVDFKI